MRLKAFGIPGTVAVTAAVFAFGALAQPKAPEDPHAPFPSFKIGEGFYDVGAEAAFRAELKKQNP